MKRTAYSHQKLKDAVSISNLSASCRKVANHYRTQNYSCSPDEALLQHSLPTVLPALREAVLDGAYSFQPLRPYYAIKPSGSVRMETMSSPFDRILIQAVLNLPGYRLQQAMSAAAQWNGYLVAPAYRFRHPRAAYAFSYWPADYRAYRRLALTMARRVPDGIALHADIQTFFPSVRRRRLQTLLEPWIGKEVWPWIERYLDFSVEQADGVQPLWDGLPIEEPMSSLLANLYLEEFDRFVLKTLQTPYCRYVDDFMFFVPNKRSAHEVRLRVEEFLATRLGLALNSNKVEDLPARVLLQTSAAHFSRRLSMVNHKVRMLEIQPALRAELSQILVDMVNDLPSPNAQESIETTQRLRAAKFATWRLARIKARDQIQRISLLLEDRRTRLIAGIALAYLGENQAVRSLMAWLAKEGSTLLPQEIRTLAAALIRNGHILALVNLEQIAPNNAELCALVRLQQCRRTQWCAAIENPDPLIRRAATLHLLGRRDKGRAFASLLCEAAKAEQHRDTLLAMLVTLAENREQAGVFSQLEEMAIHADPFVARFAAGLVSKAQDTATLNQSDHTTSATLGYNACTNAT